MKFLVILMTLVGFGETYRTSVHRCDLTLQKDGAVIEDGEQALGIGGDLNQVYCKALCSGAGPTPALKWYKEPRRSISYYKRRVYQVRTTSERINILTIRNMMFSDAGRYTCKGWIRDQGWIKTTFELVYGCRSSHHLCDRSKCISGDLVCNGVDNCRDGTDEQYCEKCAATQFQCDDGECLPAVTQCNGYFDCVDGSDEYICGCLPDFTCSHGGCVSQDKVCDGHNDCRVGEDEANCTYCDNNEFHCGKKICIAGGLVCDGQQDCVGGSDENNCPMKVSIDKTSLEVMVGDTAVLTCTAITSNSRRYKLSWTKDGTSLPDTATDGAGVLTIAHAVKADSGNYVCHGTDGVTSDNAVAELIVNEACKQGEEFKCINEEQCIPIGQRCDGYNNCLGGSDECGCYPVEFICDDGLCINVSRVCDNVRDCKGGEDEDIPGCVMFRCDDGLLIKRARLCDNVQDCKGAEDENDCPTCKPVKEFTCTSVEQCIPIDQRCDGHKNCVDSSDECGCYPEEFICDDGLCINKSRQCDNVRDCKGWEDEKDCPTCTPAKEFTCTSVEQCIPIDQRCDGHKNCVDSSDECGCYPEEFICDDGLCINKSRQCDNVRDCKGWEDEDCPACKPVKEFTCTSVEQCIPIDQRCDGHKNCVDSSDECGCYPEEFICDDGLCINKSRQCDNVRDCKGVEDEDCPTCKPVKEFTCTSIEQCIPIDQRCDGHKNCVDSSDECGCYSEEFICDDGLCINKSRQCDNVRDCKGGEDEKECPTCKPVKEFTCTSVEQCIPIEQRCDGWKNCLDGTDECGCYPEEFICDDGLCINKSRQCDNIRDCKGWEDEKDCPTCTPAKEFTCTSVEQCIPIDQRCDGHKNCVDSSDECGCYTEEFICDDGLCINKYSQCDNVRDCKGGEDEEDCPTCNPMEEFTCTISKQCIPIDRRCDGFQNCADGSDECGCYPEEFICDDGLCISKSRLCDDVRDCKGGEDEKDCQKECIESQHMCPDGSRCIETMQVCDGKMDCDNNWDEEQQCEN